jgi:cytochrome c-type biogenesis protein CcmE
VTDVRPPHHDDPGAGEGFDESPELDLSPRTPVGGAVAPRTGRRRPIGAYVALAAVVLGIGFVVLQGLGSATLYFRNVDEAVAERDELGTRRFRLQGLVVDDVASDGDAVTFTLAFNGATVPVRHAGDPPDLFRPDQSVVLEGHFVEGSDVFASDRMLVKHDEDYSEDNSERIADAEDGETG